MRAIATSRRQRRGNCSTKTRSKVSLRCIHRFSSQPQLRLTNARHLSASVCNRRRREQQILPVLIGLFSLTRLHRRPDQSHNWDWSCEPCNLRDLYIGLLGANYNILRIELFIFRSSGPFYLSSMHLTIVPYSPTTKLHCSLPDF